MDPLLSSRRVILTALKADTGVTALVPAASIYAQSVSAEVEWPFIRYGAPSDTPITAACLDGSEVAVAVHAFAKPRYDSAGAMVESAEDHCARIAGGIRGALHGRKLDLEGGGKVTLTFSSRQLLQDPAEADAYHAVVNLRARCIRE